MGRHERMAGAPTLVEALPGPDVQAHLAAMAQGMREMFGETPSQGVLMALWRFQPGAALRDMRPLEAQAPGRGRLLEVETWDGRRAVAELGEDFVAMRARGVAGILSPLAHVPDAEAEAVCRALDALDAFAGLALLVHSIDVDRVGGAAALSAPPLPAALGWAEPPEQARAGRAALVLRTRARSYRLVVDAEGAALHAGGSLVRRITSAQVAARREAWSETVVAME